MSLQSLHRRFPQRTRLAKRTEISLVRHSGREWRCPLFSVFYRANNGTNNRFAVLVGRKTGIAAVRNRIKRQIREIVRTNDWNTPPFLDIIVIPQRFSNETYQILNQRYEEWKKSIPAQ
jgi:ribonuclease P protein component